MEKVYDKPVNKTNPNLRRNNTMKKLFAILFAVAFIFGCLAMTACGKTEESLDAAYTKYLNQYKQTDSSLPTLTVAMSPDFPPMEFVDTAKKGQDQYVGFDVILANYLAKELGMNVEIKPTSVPKTTSSVTGIRREKMKATKLSSQQRQTKASSPPPSRSRVRKSVLRELLFRNSL